jgi:hypothetical protein
MPRILQQSWLEAYLKYTEETESPEAFHLWTAISVLAGSVADRIYIDRGFSKLHPHLYIMLCSPTGRCRKTTAAMIGAELLRKLDNVRILQDKMTPEKLIVALSKPLGVFGEEQKGEEGEEKKQEFFFSNSLHPNLQPLSVQHLMQLLFWKC